MQLRRLPFVPAALKSPVLPALVIAGGALLSTASGCAYGNVRQVLRAQFASDVGCSDVTLKKRDFWYVSDNPHQYKISGCGVMRTYTCTQEDAEGLISYDEPACKWEEGDADAPKPKMATASGDEGMDEDAYEPMDEPMDEPADDSDMDGESSSDGTDLDADADLDAEADAPKGKVKAKAKGGFKLGGD